MGLHWTQQLAKSISTGRPSRALERHLDALLLWLSNPNNPRAAELDRAMGHQPLSRAAATDRAYRMLDALLFASDGQAGAATLGLPEDADLTTAKQRYRRLVQVYHPDHHPDRAAWATQRTDQLNRAFAAYRKAPSARKAHGGARSPGRNAGQRRADSLWTRALETWRVAGEQLWPASWERLQAFLGTLTTANKLILASTVAMLGLVILLSAVSFGDKPKPVPKIIHHRLDTPLDTASNRPPPREAKPRAEEPARIAAIHESPPDKALGSSSLRALTQEPTARPASGLEPATPELSELEPDSDRPSALEQEIASPAPEPASPEVEPEAQAHIARSAASTATEPGPQGAPEPPSPASSTRSDTASAEDAPIADQAPLSTSASTSAHQNAPAPDRTPDLDQPDLDQPDRPRLRIPAANPPAPPAPPTAPEPPLQISQADIATPSTPAVASIPGDCSTVPEVLRRFQQNYQAGTLDQFMALYSPLAKENDLATWFAIRQTYADWFRKTSARRIRFEQVRIEPKSGGDRCAAMALFQVSYLDEQSLLATKSGIIQLLFERNGSDLRILRVRY
ncbi:J domain-containing protein [Thiocystis violacea]|uniref:J domain-containing protein n=1 Tax=Thiocystis violacea TaxID=13725 RepID=UPI0019069782|nr:J domain-containing protein [Thiocystis violacea]MBK1722291.1 hypothetical protein [Thiocystis violacea]